MNTFGEELNTFGGKLNTFAEKVNTLGPSVNTSAASAEQVFTPAPACALSKTPLRAPPDRPPSPRAALPFVLNKCTIGPAIPTSYPSCPAPPPHPPSRLPLLTSPGMPPAVSPSTLDPAINCHGPCGGVRPVRGSVSQPVLPAAGPRPNHRPAQKIRSKLSLASPIPYGDRAGERQFPPSPPPIRRPRPGSSGDRPAGSNRQGQPPKRRGV